MHHYRSKQNKAWLIVFIVLSVLLLLALGTMGYFWHRSITQNQQILADLEQQRAALVEQRDALREQLSELQERSDELTTEQQLQIEALGEALATAHQQIEELDNAVGALNLSIGGVSGSTPVYFSKPDCPADAKLIALTFDDGPNAKYTPLLLDELKKRNVRATFFVVGQSINGNEELLKRIHEEGHAIGNHTMNHKNLRDEEIDSIRQQLTDCADLVESIIGIRPTIARMPGGNMDDETRTVLAELGLPTIGWSVDTRDWESRNVDAILKETFRSGKYGARDGAIILMHDRVDVTVEAAVQIVDRLLAEGYTFVTVPELLAARKSIVLTGALYSSAFPVE